MTLSELISRFRVLAKDTAKPYLFDDPDVTGWLNDAQAQACVRGRLMLEDANPKVCQIELIPGQHTYPLHACLYELVTLRVTPPDPFCRQPLLLKSREWLNNHEPNWREMEGQALYAIQGDTTIRIVGVPTSPGTLHIEGYRLPLKPMSCENDKPEIHQAHHEHLIHWALFKGFGIPDADTFDSNRAAIAEKAFTKYFGLLPDSGMRRETRSDLDQTNKVYV